MHLVTELLNKGGDMRGFEVARERLLDHRRSGSVALRPYVARKRCEEQTSEKCRKEEVPRYADRRRDKLCARNPNSAG